MNDIYIMHHAQIMPSGAIRCIYNVIRAIGTHRCIATYAAGTPEHAAAYAQARASGVLVVAVEPEPTAIPWHDVPQPR